MLPPHVHPPPTPGKGRSYAKFSNAKTRKLESRPIIARHISADMASELFETLKSSNPASTANQRHWKLMTWTKLYKCTAHVSILKPHQSDWMYLEHILWALLYTSTWIAMHKRGASTFRLSPQIFDHRHSRLTIMHCERVRRTILFVIGNMSLYRDCRLTVTQPRRVPLTRFTRI